MICDADLKDEVVQEYEEILGHTVYCIDYTYRKLADRICYFRSDKASQFIRIQHIHWNGCAIFEFLRSIHTVRMHFQLSNVIV